MDSSIGKLALVIVLMAGLHRDIHAESTPPATAEAIPLPRRDDLFQDHFLELYTVRGGLRVQVEALLRFIEKTGVGEGTRGQHHVVEQTFVFLLEQGGEAPMALTATPVTSMVQQSFRIGPQVFAEALLPYLDDSRTNVVHTATEMLETAGLFAASDRRSGVYYREVRQIIERLEDPDVLPPGLWLVLYNRDPERAYGTRPRYARSPEDEAAEHREAVHLHKLVSWISYARQQRSSSVVTGDQPDPLAAALLVQLSSHRWWHVRMYVAAVMSRTPAFVSKEVLDRLETDERPAVRMMARQAARHLAQ